MGSGGGASVMRENPNIRKMKQSLTKQSSLSSVQEEEKQHHTPRGLTNVGNTCYSNSVIQCLLSTALSDALLHPKASVIFRQYSVNHKLLVDSSASVDSSESASIESARRSQARLRRMQQRKSKDGLDSQSCEWLSKELTDVTREYVRPLKVKQKTTSLFPWGNFLSGPSSDPDPTGVVNPGSITRHPDRLSKCLRPYRQEDAHEFLRALLSTLTMHGHNKKMSSLFDGLLESAVTCQFCDHSSLTRDRYMDLSLDIQHASTISEALTYFTKTEVLEGDNQVMCDKCGVKRDVTKGLRLATAPSILVCHLKRFSFDRFGRASRLNKHVRFPLHLEIGDCMSQMNKSTPSPYELVGVLVHKGRTCDSGHYLAYIKSGKKWFKANDSVVTEVDVDVVLSQQAYVLFYEVAGMRKKEGFTTPHAHRRPHPNLADPRQAPSDDRSVPSQASTDVSEDERDGPDNACLSMNLFSIMQNACSEVNSMIEGDLCCQMTNFSNESTETDKDTIASLDHITHVVVDDATLGDSTLGDSSLDSAGRRRMLKSTSSGNLSELNKRSSKAYHGKSAPNQQGPPCRTLSFHGSDPGVRTIGLRTPRRKPASRRRSESSLNQRRRSPKVLTPRRWKRDGRPPPLDHHTHHASVTPEELGTPCR